MTASAPSFGHWSHEGRTSETGCGFIRTCIVIGRSLAGSIHFRADGRLERHARGLARGFRSRHFSGQIFHDGKPDSAVPRALAKKRHSKLRSPGPEEPDRLMGPRGGVARCVQATSVAAVATGCQRLHYLVTVPASLHIDATRCPLCQHELAFGDAGRGMPWRSIRAT